MYGCNGICTKTEVQECVLLLVCLQGKRISEVGTLMARKHEGRFGGLVGAGGGSVGVLRSFIFYSSTQGKCSG